MSTPITSQRFFDRHAILHELRRKILIGKGGNEYNSNDDRTVNFKNDEKEVGIDRLQAWMLVFNKQVRAVQSFVRRVVEEDQRRRSIPNAHGDDFNPEHPRYWRSIVESLELSEGIELRAADIMNYLDLLFALLEERGYVPEALVVPPTKAQGIAAPATVVSPLHDLYGCVMAKRQHWRSTALAIIETHYERLPTKITGWAIAAKVDWDLLERDVFEAVRRGT